MKWLVILSALLLSGVPVNAQTVALRSGEHAEFSRLTLNLPKRVGFAILMEQRTAHITFENSAINIDTGSVFDRIPRTRLAAANWNTVRKRLELALNCACSVEGFWHGNTLLVLDIRKIRSADDPAPLRSVAPISKLSHAATLFVNERGRTLPKPPEKMAQQPDTDTHMRADEMRTTLLRQIEKAAEHGLLAPVETLPPYDLPHDASTPNTPRPDPPGQMRVRSVLGPVKNATLPSLTTGPYAHECLPDHLFEIPTWAGPEPFPALLARHRSGVIGQSGKMNDRALYDLAKLYLYFGLGAEALETLSLLNDPGPQTPTLRALARIAEERSTEHLSGQTHCEGPVAMWSLLSGKAPPSSEPLAENEVLKAFSALPLHLKRHYGPRLAEELETWGHSKIQAALIRMLRRSEIKPLSLLKHIQENPNIAAHQSDEATAQLESTSRKNDQISAIAFAQMLDQQLAKGMPLSGEEAELAGAYAFEFRNDPAAPHDFQRTYILALAASGQFDLAFAETRKTNDTSVRSHVVEILSDQAADIEFLQHALSGELIELSPLVANAVAQRLIELGFPYEAVSFVSDDLARNTKGFNERRLLRAELALAQNKPRKAMVELLRVEGPNAQALREHAAAKARTNAATFPELFPEYRTATPPEPDRQYYPSGELARHHDLLGAAAQARLHITELLGDTLLTGQPN